jgi:cobalamin biosynthesis Mg chelatase CobN
VAWGSIVSAFRWVGGSLTPLANLTGMGNWEYLEVDGVVTGDTAVIAFLDTYRMRLYVSIIPLNGECTPSGISGAVTTTVAPVTTTTTVTTTVTVGNTTTVARTATVYVNTTVTVPVNRTVTVTVVRYLTTTVRAPASGVPIVIVVVIVAIVAIVVFLVTRRHYAW